MYRKFNSALFAVVTTGLFGISAAMAAPSYLDGSSKARGDYGQGVGSVAAPTYRATPAVRSFSYEPSQNLIGSTEKSKANNSAKVETKKATAPATAAQKDARAMRSFSYDPAAGTGAVSNRVRGSSTPLYSLPKTDARKFGGNW